MSWNLADIPPHIRELNQEILNVFSEKPKVIVEQPKDLEETLLQQIQLAGLPEPEREYKFHPDRKWRFDFAWPDLMIATECNGGTWNYGRHNRGSSIGSDYEKVNTAQALGWRVYQFTVDQIESQYAITFLMEWLG